ncbi:hypothetical protein HDV01_006389 [Terramyces sp. JEL0728]|nr:hypothetical protein HDV01_006389 [Terramyces sp. JEL0728]
MKKAQRERTIYEIHHSNTVRQRISDREFENFIAAIEANSQASFGVVHISQFDLNQFYSGKTLLEYCFIFKRDVIASLLLRGGADPSISKYNLNGYGVLDIMWKKLPAYATWIIMLVFQLRTGVIADTCINCEKETTCFTFPSCTHNTCEMCFWQIFLENDTFNDMECKCGVAIDLEKPSECTNTKHRSPSEIYQQSLDLYLKLDTKLNKQNIPKKPVFKALRMSELNRMYLGTVRSQRNTELFKAATIGNEAKVKALIEAGAELNVRNEYGQTALFIATWKRNGKIVELLVKSGADESIPEHSGVLARDSTKIYKALSTDKPGKATKLLQLYPNHIGNTGKGSFYLDGCFTDEFINTMISMFHRLPVAQAQKKSCSNRSYYCDTLKAVQQQFNSAMEISGISTKIIAMPQMRYLDYEFQGGWLPAHIDLSRTEGTKRSTHTFILYLSDCEYGGETAILESIPKPGSKGNLLELVKPVTGRLFCFPHECPHEGRTTISVPKLLLRGEVLFEE